MKDTLKQVTGWENILAIHTSHKELVSKIYKESMKINETRHTAQQKSGEKTFEYTLHKREYPCSQKGCEKGFNIIG